MTFSDFCVKLRRVNPRLRVVAHTDGTFAGIEERGNEDKLSICGVSKLGLSTNQSIREPSGRLLVRSVRDVLMILKDKKKIDRRKAEKEFRIKLDCTWPHITDGSRI